MVEGSHEGSVEGSHSEGVEVSQTGVVVGSHSGTVEGSHEGVVVSHDGLVRFVEQTVGFGLDWSFDFANLISSSLMFSSSFGAYVKRLKRVNELKSRRKSKSSSSMAKVGNC